MNSGDIKEFHKYMNSLNPAIKFTKEIEKYDKLPFLDVEIMEKPNGELETSSYEKKTDSGNQVIVEIKRLEQRENNGMKEKANNVMVISLS
jgi:hypothetical protein